MEERDVLGLQRLEDPRDGVITGGQQEDSDFSIFCDCNQCSGFSVLCSG